MSAGRLAQEVALVTGAARGIGRATAQLFAAEGAQVVLFDRDVDVAKAVASEFCAAGHAATAVSLDVTDATACEAGVTRAADRFGPPTVLVNNAGLTRDAMVHRMSDEQWQTVIDIHLRGCFNMIRAVAPYFRRESGKAAIVNIASVSAQRGTIGQFNYAAAKAGVIGLTRSLANEWARFGVRVNAVAFGLIDTRLTRAKESGVVVDGEVLGIPSDLREALIGRIPLRRTGTVEEAARAILFLASDEASYITGHTLNVNGGSYMG